MDKPFDEIVYLTLTDDNQQRVYHIYNIASMLHHNRIPPLTEKEFDELYDKSIKELEMLTGDIATKLMKLP
jgi:hypothetical protein